MKLYIKQKPLSLKQRFFVINSKEEDRYFVEGEAISFGRRLHIFDNANKEIATIRQKFLSTQPRFFVYQSGKPVMEVVQKFTLIKHKYAINGSDWTACGDLGEHEYYITCSYGKVVVVKRTEFAGVDCIEMDLSNTVNEAILVRAIATVLAIDCVVTKKRMKKNKTTKSITTD